MITPHAYRARFARAALASLPVLLSLTAVSCAPSGRLGGRGAFTVLAQEDMPSGRDGMRQAYGEPTRSGVVLGGGKDERDVTEALDLLKRQDSAEAAAGYDIFFVPRATAGSSVGAVGVCWDYVFYDSEGRVLGRTRRFVD